MDVQAETSKRIEELEKENKELREKLDKCRKLLRMAVNGLEEQMNNLCETVGDMNSVYSSCPICANQERCKDNYVGFVKWIHADEVREVLKDE